MMKSPESRPTDETPHQLARVDFPPGATPQVIADRLNRLRAQFSSGSRNPPDATSVARAGASAPESATGADELSRPHQDEGMLISPLTPPRTAAALFAACETALVSHLQSVCLWPAAERNRRWRVGDSAFYIIEFSPAPTLQPYLQLYSEPDEAGAIVEVCSGAQDESIKAYMNSDKQEQLRDHGFEIGGEASNFRKIIAIERASDVHAVAREVMAIVCEGLGYDGTTALRFTRTLQTPTTVGPLLSDLSPDTLKKLLHEWGYAAELTVDGRTPALIASGTEHGSFQVTFTDPSGKGSNHFLALQLRATRPMADSATALVVADRINRRLRDGKVTVSRENVFVIEAHVLLRGGVTADHLRARFEAWRQMVGNVATWIEAR
jgi:hypothetical protein